jgi:hypothetical protein
MHTALVSRLIKDRSAWELAHVPVKAEAVGDQVAAGSEDALGSPVLVGA